MSSSGSGPESDGSWVRAYALAMYGEPVTFTGAYAAVTVVRNNDDSFTADIMQPSGRRDTRVYARGSASLTAVATECASIAAHGPQAPVCRSGQDRRLWGHRLCGHVTFTSPPGGAR